MRRTALLLALAGFCLVGCENNKTDDMAAAPADGSRPGAFAEDGSTGSESAVMPPPPLGNEAAASSTAPPEPVPAVGPAGSAAGQVYTVQKGDTLYAIARKVYGDPRKVKDILAANPQITDANKIKVGQKLTLP